MRLALDAMLLVSVIIVSAMSFLFCVCLSFYFKSIGGFTGAVKYLLFYGEDCMRIARIRDMVQKKASVSFKPIIVSSVLSVAAIYVLRNP